MREKRRKDSRRESKRRPRGCFRSICSKLRLLLPFIGIGFIFFNIYLMTRIKPDKEYESLPHHELDYSKLRDFSNLDLSIKPHNLTYQPKPKKSKLEPNVIISSETSPATTLETEKSNSEQFNLTRVPKIDENREQAAVPAEEAKPVEVGKVNPLLWQLHKQHKDGNCCSLR